MADLSFRFLKITITVLFSYFKDLYLVLPHDKLPHYTVGRVNIA